MNFIAFIAALFAVIAYVQALPIVVVVTKTSDSNAVNTQAPEDAVNTAYADQNDQAAAAATAVSNASTQTQASNVNSVSNSGDWIVSMLCRVNAVRAQHGVQPLGLSPELNSIAQSHSAHMSNVRSMTHDDPDGTLGTRLARSSVGWGFAAENIAEGMNDPSQAQQVLEDSPDHLANMINPQLAYFGAGNTNGYYAQDFYALADNTRPSNIPNCS